MEDWIVYEEPPGGFPQQTQQSLPPEPKKKATLAGFQSAYNKVTPERRVVGTNQFLSQDYIRNRPIVELSEDGDILLNLVEVPIEKAAQAVFVDALGRSYAIKPGVSGTITLQTTKPLSEREAVEAFQTVLELGGATLEIADDLFTIIPLDASSRRISFLDQQAVIGARMVAVPLQYVGAAEMLRLLEPIAGDSVRLFPVPSRNLLLISGTKTDINIAIEAINLFDIDVIEGKSIGLFKLRAADPNSVIQELNAIFETEEGGALQDVVSFIPSERLGAIVIVTTQSQYLQTAERWIKDLDRTAGSSQRRPLVYSLQNRSAAELAPILTEMLDNVGSGTDATEGGSQLNTAKIVADDTQNALIVWGNDVEQSNFANIIQVLDRTPVQVLLEATIAEVSLNDELSFGLRWFFQRGRFSGGVNDVASSTIGNRFPGLSILFQGNDAQVALSALADVTDVNVISSPSVMVLDNKEAVLQIGDEVPVAIQQVQDTTNPDAPIVNTISFRDTGIILRVKPRVSAQGRVILDIEQEVSSVSDTTTSGIDSPTISQRRIQTSVAVDDGQTMALGGLIQQAKNTVNSKVPGLGDAPVVGPLFRNRTDQFGKTELLILITPRVVANPSESISVTNDLRRELQNADLLIRRGIQEKNDFHRIIE